jgi:ubiquitin-like 1-activating enzyme E1 B
MFDKDDINAV